MSRPVRKWTLASFVTYLRAYSVVTKRGCWEWQGTLCDVGYAKVSVVIFGVLHRRAHRALLSLRVGRKLRRDEYATHSCDNKRCVRPQHVEQGTPTSNIREAMARLGAAPRAVSSAVALEIQEAYDAGLGAQRDLAAEFGICQGTVWKIVNNIHPYREVA